jgi:translation initiation factor 2 alpha subunit (eIF-2alpha)
MDLEEGDSVLCIVERIAGTTVFVKIEGDGEGSIILSEIAPGRIRNIRNYVVPKKKIVCKILRISGNRIELSLRRVTPKERKEVLDEYKQEKSYVSMLRSILGEKSKEVIAKISEKERMYDFFQEVKSDPKVLEKIVGKNDSEKIMKILESQKPKIISVKKEISLKSTNLSGLRDIKKVFENLKDVEIKYLSGGIYSLQSGSEDPKKTDHHLKEILKDIEKKSKKNNIEFSILKK